MYKRQTLAQDLYSLLESNDYVAILPYVYPSEDVEKALLALRDKIMARTKRAVLFGFGPRYLHSTGQLHKGDGNNGVFLILSAEPANDIKIPGQRYTFGQLCNAQALGEKLREALTAAFADGHLTPEELANIKSIVKEMNDAMLEAQRLAEEDARYAEMQKLLRRAQTAGLDEVYDYAGQIQSSRDENLLSLIHI